MSPSGLRGETASARLVTGRAHATQTEGTSGRTLFPSLEFSHWPPFETFVESTMRGTGAADPHAHAGQEIANYVLSGALQVYDEGRQCTEILTGSVSLFSTPRSQVHDVSPPPGLVAHWVSLVLHLPAGLAPPQRSYQAAAATPTGNLPPGVEGLSVVGGSSPIRSLAGLEVSDVRFLRRREIDFPLGEHRTVVVYVLEGAVHAMGRKLPAGSGLQAEGLSVLPIEGEMGSRLIHASASRGRSEE